MLALRFSNPADTASLETVRSPGFSLESAFILAQPGSARIARYSGGQWWIGEQGFLRVECDGPVVCCVSLLASTERLGPFRGVRVLDGMLLADEQPIARMRSHERWGPLDGSATWLRIALEAVANQR